MEHLLGMQGCVHQSIPARRKDNAGIIQLMIYRASCRAFIAYPEREVASREPARQNIATATGGVLFP